MNPHPSASFAALPTLGESLRYGLLGLPLAFAALPLFVQWPAFYAAAMAVPLAALGWLLLAVRGVDALIDPWIGQRADAWLARSGGRALAVAAAAALGLVLGMAGLFQTPATLAASSMGTRLAWAGAALALTTASYSVVQVIHQAWGARLGNGAASQARWMAGREGLALVGVLCASALPLWLGWGAITGLLAGALLLGLLSLARGARPSARAPMRTQAQTQTPLTLSPWRSRAFRRLLVVFVLNGLASAIPASLVLFFVRDRLQASPAWEAGLLVAYFLAGAVSVPGWAAGVRRWGLARTWGAAMVLAMASFAATVTMAPGDVWAFLAVCVLSGWALGADLIVPPAMLAQALRQQGGQDQAEGRWFGWWNLATKLNLALAAGLALPLVQWMGYRPGAQDPMLPGSTWTALTLVYGGLPCAVKAAALLALWQWRQEWRELDDRAEPPPATI